VTFRDGGGSTLSSSAKDWVFLHQGGEKIAAGDYEFRNRVYSPTLGRWLSNDPLGFEAGDVNVYRFVVNSPICTSDPSGLGPVDFLWGVGEGAVGGLVGGLVIAGISTVSAPIGAAIGITVSAAGIYYTGAVLLDPNIPAPDKHRAIGQLIGGLIGGIKGFRIGTWIGGKVRPPKPTKPSPRPETPKPSQQADPPSYTRPPSVETPSPMPPKPPQEFIPPKTWHNGINRAEYINQLRSQLARAHSRKPLDLDSIDYLTAELARVLSNPNWPK